MQFKLRKVKCMMKISSFAECVIPRLLIFLSHRTFFSLSISAFKKRKKRIRNLDWFKQLQRDDALKPRSERLLSCIAENKIRYILETEYGEFCLHEIFTLSFRMSVQLLQNGFNKVNGIWKVKQTDFRKLIKNYSLLNVILMAS